MSIAFVKTVQAKRLEGNYQYLGDTNEFIDTDIGVSPHVLPLDDPASRSAEISKEQSRTHVAPSSEKCLSYSDCRSKYAFPVSDHEFRYGDECRSNAT